MEFSMRNELNLVWKKCRKKQKRLRAGIRTEKEYAKKSESVFPRTKFYFKFYCGIYFGNSR